jgi:hypothetical protein
LGSLGFVLFVGLLVPAGASLLYLVFRRFLPDPEWIGGVIFGLLLFATFGVNDPLSSDNVDFNIVSPLPLALTLVMVTAILFGVTFAALAARLDHRMALIADRGWKTKIAYLSLSALVFLMVAIVYIAVRVIARGRIGEVLKQRPIQLAGHALLLLAASAAAIAVLRTTAEILRRRIVDASVRRCPITMANGGGQVAADRRHAEGLGAACRRRVRATALAPNSGTESRAEGRPR